MKSFLNFFSEARVTRAAQEAKKRGLTYKDGYWVNRSGKRIARTEDGELKLLSNREAAQEEEPTQGKEKEEDQQVQSSGEEGEETPKKTEEKDVTIVFGRFNPPTIGHKLVLDKASSLPGDYVVYPSRSNDPQKNPLDPSEKTEMMKKMFPKHASSIVNDDSIRTIFDALKVADDQGYTNVNIVVGSDRISEFDSLAQKYNGEMYNFEEINTISAGERDEEESGVGGMSASKMRKAAAEDDFDSFRKGIPEEMDDKDVRSLLNLLRKRMNVTEGWNLWEIAPKFDWKNLRENYVTGKIFNLDQIVESLKTGLIGKVIRRGTNYLICVTEEDVMFKSWIRDLKEYTEVKMERKMRTKNKPNTLEGTGGYFKNVAAITPGFEKGDKTNLQPGGKPYKGYQKQTVKEFINRFRKN
jgi:phosphopantetheine adenylyltransferase|tara:strand:- start:4593 stop:5828 length:1236 start_codon:yes stop_codon:yes gene_type:complete